MGRIVPKGEAVDVFNRKVFFKFRCCDEWCYVIKFGVDCVTIEEALKDGPKHKHKEGMLVFSGGNWLVSYSENLDDEPIRIALCDFFREHFGKLASYPE